MTADLNLECRMYRSRIPEIGKAVMIQVNAIDDDGASVSLLEFNNIEGRIDDPSCRDHTVVGRIQPVDVLNVDENDDRVSILLSNPMSVSEERKNILEGEYNKSKYVQTIMRKVAKTLGQDLELMSFQERLLRQKQLPNLVVLKRFENPTKAFPRCGETPKYMELISTLQSISNFC